MDQFDKTQIFQEQLGVTDSILHEIVTDNFALRFAARQRDMELHLSAIPYTSGTFPTPEKLLELFARFSITGSVDKLALKNFCEKVSQGEIVEGVIIVRGKPPEHGDDQEQLFHVKAKLVEPPPSGQYDEQKDYHALNLFENVSKNKLIAELLPDTEGISGKTILGVYTPALPGHKLTKSLRAGANVFTDKTGTKFYAQIDGMVIYDRRKEIIEVSDVYTIKGNVDYTTGDIDFIGAVEVMGDVTDTYHIKANKWITVHNHVGNCNLNSGGDMTLHGVDAGGDAILSCKGTLKAKYLHGSQVECEGNIYISTEAVNCKLHSEKAIMAKHGAIIGGEAVALKGFEVQTLGTDAQVKTHIISGISYQMQEAITALRQEVSVFKEQIDSISKKLDPFVTNPRNLLSLNNDGREKVKEMAKEFKDIVALNDDKTHELKQLSKESLHGANPMISVVKCIEPEVIITIGTSIQKFQERTVGQRSFIENSLHGGLRPIPYYPIDKSARDIEHAIVQEIKKKKESTSE